MSGNDGQVAGPPTDHKLTEAAAATLLDQRTKTTPLLLGDREVIVK